MIHIYDKPLMELADEWKQAIEAGASAEERFRVTQTAVNLLRKIAGSGRQTASVQNSTAVDPSTGGTGYNDNTQPILQIAEFHLRYDADGDGMMEDVMLICDVKTRTPIFYDYLPNVTPDGLRPFTCVRVNEVLGRWYGVGAMEMFESSQKIIDLWINRKNFANSNAARVDFWAPDNTVEGRANEDLTLNWGSTYTPIPGKKAADCLESIYLENNTGEDLQLMIEFFMQIMMNESGIANANDGNAAGMDSAKLATGIRNIEKSGQELFSLFLGHLEPGISESLGKMIKILFARMDEMEIHRYFEDGEAGGEGSGLLLAIDPGDLVNLEIDTRVLLTRYRGEQVIESNLAAWKVALEYYGIINPEIQQRLQPLVEDILSAYQVQNPRELTQPLTNPMMVPPTPGAINPQQAAQAGAPKPRQGEPNM